MRPPRLSLGKRLILWYGNGWLWIFGRFPQIMPFFVQKFFRTDKQLLELLPKK